MKPVHNLLLRLQNAAPGQGGAVHHDDGKFQFACGIQFRTRSNATGVFGDDHVDGVALQQRAIPGQVKGTGGDFKRVVGQGNWGFGLVHKAQKIVMLRGFGEKINVLLANRQKDTTRFVTKCCQNVGVIRDMLPGIPFTRLPGRAFKADQRRVGPGDSHERIARHLRGERMGCINDMGDLFRMDVINQTVDTAKAPYTGGQGLAARGVGASGVGKNGICTAFRQMARQVRGFGRTAQKKDFLHV